MCTESEIRQYILSVGKNYRTRKIKQNNDYYEYLLTKYNGISDDLSEIIYLFTNNIEKPKCVVCNSYVKWHGSGKYKSTCSHECRAKLTDYDTRNEKIKKTMVEKYGVDNALKLVDRSKPLIFSPEGKQRQRENGSRNFKAMRETFKEKYGVSNPSQIPDIKERVKKTNLERYGNETYLHSDEYKEIQRQRVLKRVIRQYGDALNGTISNISKGHTDHVYSIYRVHYTCEQCKNEQLIPIETFKWRFNRYNDVCRECIGIEYNSSMGEKEISRYVESLGLEVINNYRSEDNIELDIYIPSHNVGIEFNGLYWHSVEAGKDTNYHIDKTESFKSKGIKVIHIFEDEWYMNSDIVKSMIKSSLGIYDTRIYARKTEIIEIDAKTAREFLDNNHIMGYHQCSKKYGLYNNGVLVSVMTFSKGNHSRKSYGWEIDRYASLLGHQVVGGASKLFKKFINDVNPEEVVSYADLRFGEGNVYSKLGFSLVSQTVPNYWYTKGEQRYHRFSMRKGSVKGDDVALTESENRSNQGFNKIYDCGHNKWKWSN